MRTRLLLFTALLMTAACGSDSQSSLAPTSAGVFTITDLAVGTGATAVTGNHVTVTYTGWLYDTSKPESKGNQFDTGTFPFTLGAGTVIKGWDQGIPGMKVGGRRRLIIPPELAYGSQPPSGSAIPTNATLLFDVTLVSIP